MPKQNTIKHHKTIPILVLENERRKKKRIAYHLQNMVENADITTFKSLAKTRKYIREGGLADIFFCDLDIQGGDGFFAAQELQRRNPKANIIFADEEHPEVNGVPKTSFMFNPVKVDGQWYLTVKRADQNIDRIP